MEWGRSRRRVRRSRISRVRSLPRPLMRGAPFSRSSLRPGHSTTVDPHPAGLLRRPPERRIGARRPQAQRLAPGIHQQDAAERAAQQLDHHVGELLQSSVERLGLAEGGARPKEQVLAPLHLLLRPQVDKVAGAADAPPQGVEEPGRGVEDRDLFACTAADGRLVIADLAALLVQHAADPARLSRVGVEQLDRRAEDLLAAIAEDLLRSPVELGHEAAAVDRDDAVGRAADEPLLAIDQLGALDGHHGGLAEDPHDELVLGAEAGVGQRLAVGAFLVVGAQ